MSLNNKDEKVSNKRNRWLWGSVLVLIICALLFLLYWVFVGRFHIRTNDAYVTGNQVMLTPQVSGGVRAIFADETDLVRKGQLVVELDCLQNQLDYQEKKASLAQIVRNVKELFEDVSAKEAQLNLRKAQLRQAELDFEHREPLVKSGAVSVEEFEQYNTNVDVARAEQDFAAQTLVIAKQKVKNTTVETHPLVQEAVSRFRESYLNLIRCKVGSPVTGYVAKRTVQVGDQVVAGQTLLQIVPLDYLWIEANYKETQLRKVRIGQPVTFWSDLYGPFVTFHGKVIGLQPGSGNAFALLPAENASGNWIKIIQRVPVRISIDRKDLETHPLVVGLSLHTNINVSDIDGKMLSTIVTDEPIYTTGIYDTQMDELQELTKTIEAIIKENAS